MLVVPNGTNALASAEDVAEIWRDLSTDEETRASDLCARASVLLRQRLRNIDDRIELNQTDPTAVAALDPGTVATVVATMVKRVMVNADGAFSRSKTTGPFAESVTYVAGRAGESKAAANLGELVVTDADVAKLTPRTRVGQPHSIKVKAGLAARHRPLTDAEITDSLVGYPTVDGINPAGY